MKKNNELNSFFAALACCSAGNQTGNMYNEVKHTDSAEIYWKESMTESQIQDF